MRCAYLVQMGVDNRNRLVDAVKNAKVGWQPRVKGQTSCGFTAGD